MQLIPVIEYVERYRSEQAAREGLEFLRTQVDFRGGRILPATEVNPAWRTQTFFDDSIEAKAGLPLPDGCNRRLCPDYMLER